MKRVLLTVLVLFIGLFIITGCKNNDAMKFKKEYESLNGTKNKNGKEYRSVSIDSNNPFVYKNENDIVDMINNKETFLVYFGFPNCPWCRSILDNLIKSAKDNDIETIYYVNILDIRDTIDKNGNKTKEGTDGYYKLLELMNNVLEDYDLKDDNDNKIETNEKRIYAPNIVSVIDGEVTKLTTGISEKQTDGYMELTDEMNKESYDMINDVILDVQIALTTCDKSC